jgi:hypothetical protein
MITISSTEKRIVRVLWKSELTTDEIADELGWTVAQVRYVAKLLKLGKRQTVTYLPSPQEIRIAASQIRAGWSSLEREARISAAWSSKMKSTREHKYGRATRDTDSDVFSEGGDSPADTGRGGY